MGTVIDLAAVRAARQGSRPADPPPTAPAPPRWRESQRGNWLTRDARSGLHLVLYETRRGWSGRATPPAGEGFYVDVPQTAGTLAGAQAWAEDWLGMQCIAEASETRV